MLTFKPLQLSDRSVVEPILQSVDSKSCDYSFANNFIWTKPNNVQFAIVDGFYCLKSTWKAGAVYTNPVGTGDRSAVIEALIADANQAGVPFRLRGLLVDDVAELNRLFPDRFEITENRDQFDYIYKVEDLVNLTGKKYAAKRNHISRFLDNPDWAYEHITQQNIDDCLVMGDKWCQLHGCGDDPGLKKEMCAVRTALKQFFELRFSGGLLRLNGEVVAFTIGEPLSSDTYNVHIEKAFSDIQGAYQMINRQFLIHNCQSFTYVNREEDMGDEGLRKVKLSYRPEILLEKYTAKLVKE